MRILLIFLTGCCVTFIGFCQELVQTDTLLAHQYYAKADSLFANNHPVDAKIWFEKAAREYKERGVFEQYFKALLRISDVYEHQADFARSGQNLLKIQQEIKDVLGDKSSSYSDVLSNMGALMTAQGKYDSAVLNYKNALQIRRSLYSKQDIEVIRAEAALGFAYSDFGKTDSALMYLWPALKKMKILYGDGHKEVGNLLNALGTAHQRNKTYDSAGYYQQKALKIWQKYYDESSSYMGLIYNTLGIISSELGRYEESLGYYGKSLAVVEHVYGKRHPYVAIISNNMANVYRYQGNTTLALEYFERGLAIFQEKFKEGHEKIPGFYGNIGALYKSVGKNALALDYYLKSLEMSIDLLGGNHPTIIIKYNRVGDAYAALGEYVQAEEYFSKSLALITRVHGNKPHIDWADYYGKIAYVYSKTNRLKLATSHYLKSINLYTDLLGPRHPLVSTFYYELAEIYKEKEDFPTALDYYQKALITNSSTFDNSSIYVNPPFDASLDQRQMLGILYAKSVAFYDQYKIRKTEEFARNSYEVLLRADSLIGELRTKYHKYEDQMDLGKTTLKIYEQAIEVSHLLYTLTGKQFYINKAFYFAEEGKYEALSQSVNNLVAKNIGLIPDSIINLEQSIKHDKAYFESLLITQKTTKDGYDTVKYRYNSQRLFETNRKHDSLVLALEEKYPDYYQLKYRNNTIKVEDLQKQIPVNTAMVEYFMGDSSMYIFTITRNDYYVSSIPKIKTISDHLDSLRKVMIQLSSADQSEQVYKQFTRLSHVLYRDLLEESLTRALVHNKVENLIVIPDNRLSYIPFELLVNTNNSDQVIGDYSSLHYLVKDYNISYAYSATLNYSKKHKNSKKVTNYFVGYAPTYNHINEFDSTYQLAYGKFRSSLPTLQWNQKEVETAAVFMEGDPRFAIEATESKFKAEAQNYSIIHLAMHALLDDENPMLSKLIFAQDKQDTLNDGYLHTYELFNMEMNPELVVLSACNTGFGKVERGEGVVSLAYAFAYSGCRSILMSQWPVDDKSTSELMNHFYKNISEGMSKSEALRKAKLEFLKDPTSRYSNPSYWAGFVLIGNTDTIELKQTNYWLITTLSAIAFAIILVIFFVLRKINQSSLSRS